MTSQFHIVDVNQCLDWAIKENNLFDVEYFNIKNIKHEKSHNHIYFIFSHEQL